MSEQLMDQSPSPHTYPHHLGEVNAAQLAQDIAEHPDAYHPGLDPHMLANGIEVQRPVFEERAVREAETEPVRAHNWEQIDADVQISPQHEGEHDRLGSLVDPSYADRSKTEQRAVSVIAELGNVAEANGESQSLTAELTAMPEKLKLRIEQALAASEFQRSPDLEKAIKSYYVDHNRMAKIIEAVAGNSLTPEDSQKILEGAFDGPSYVMNAALHELVGAHTGGVSRKETLEQAQKMVNFMVFNEIAVGAMTLQEADLDVIPRLSEKIHTAAEEEGIFQNDFSRDIDRGLPQDWKEGRLRLDEKAWDDTRAAGQLLFHNTPFLNSSVHNQGQSFALRSRSDRLRNDGRAQMTTVHGSKGFAMHTNVTHWSEEFMPRAYKTPQQEQDGSKYPGTIAVPLAEIIRTAPYGRDCEYAVLELKPGAHHEVPVNAGLNLRDDFAGHPDIMGREGQDRVFFADATDPLKGHEYIIDYGKDMRSEYGNTSHIIQLQGDYNKAVFDAEGNVIRMPGSVPVYGSGEGFPQSHIFAYDIPKDGNNYRVGQKINHVFRPEAMSQLGRPFAYDTGNGVDETGSFRGGMSRDEQLKELAEQIAELQKQSREMPQFRNKVVVPLRQGVIAYENEGSNRDRAFSGVRVARQGHDVNVLHAA